LRSVFAHYRAVKQNGIRVSARPSNDHSPSLRAQRHA
jgi:hypothetical protein